MSLEEAKEVQVAPDVQYATFSLPNFYFTVPKPEGGKWRLQFTNGVLRIPANEVDKIAAIDAALAEPDGVSQHFTKVDRAAAEARLREELANMQGAAIKGGMTSAAKEMLQANVRADSRGHIGDTIPNDPSAVEKLREELAHGDMEVLETVKQPAQAPGLKLR